MLLMAQSIQSPDGNLHLNFELKEGHPTYQLTFKGKEVIKPSKLGLELKNKPSLTDGFSLKDSKLDSKNETWTPVWLVNGSSTCTKNVATDGEISGSDGARKPRENEPRSSRLSSGCQRSANFGENALPKSS